MEDIFTLVISNFQMVFPFFANTEKEVIFNILLGKKKFWDTFVTQKMGKSMFGGLFHWIIVALGLVGL